jgi:tetratricopeptide (TPR) repeat protein
VLIVVAVGGVYGLRPDLFAGLLGPSVPQLAQDHLTLGYQSIRKGSLSAIDDAGDNFSKANALAPQWADAKAALAEAKLARADALAASGDASKEVKSLREAAFGLATEALRIAPDALSTNRAMAEYYRQTGGDAQLRTVVAKAEKVAPDDPGIATILGAHAAARPTGVERAARYLDVALEHQPDDMRARYIIAEVDVAQGNERRARAHLEHIIEAVPDHEPASTPRLPRSPRPSQPPSPSLSLSPSPSPIATAPSTGCSTGPSACGAPTTATRPLVSTNKHSSCAPMTSTL